jgi:cytochrome c oxidase subunit 2
MTRRPARLVERLVLCGALAAASACRGGEDMMAPAGPAAERIAHLGWFVLGAFTVVSAAMWGLVFWTAMRRRGTLDSHMPWNAPGDERWITIGGFTIPAIVFAAMFVVMLRTMTAFPMGDHDMPGMAAAVRVTGHQWWWEVEYLDRQVARAVVTANEVHVPVGQPIDIELRSADVIHSFWVPRLHGKVDLVPGLVTRIRIQANAPGVYPGQCGEFCGAQHAHMAMLVVAEPEAEYAAWLDHLRSNAAVPATRMTTAGQHAFMAHQCALCHEIRGTDARGTVGPDLTHFGARRGLAANSQPNATATLSAWVTHAQALKPFAQMPNLTVLTGEEQQSVVAYLESLQ